MSSLPRILVRDGAMILAQPDVALPRLHILAASDTGTAEQPALDLCSPCRVELLQTGGTSTMLQSNYDGIEIVAAVASDQARVSGRVRAWATLRTPGGTRLRFDDEYSGNNGALILDRQVAVEAVGDADGAFLSEFSVALTMPTDLRELLWFSPAMWYLDNRYLSRHMIGSDWSLDKHFFREDRGALPLVMAFHPPSGMWYSLARRDLDGATIAADCTWEPLIDERLRYGALGAQRVRRTAEASPGTGSRMIGSVAGGAHQSSTSTSMEIVTTELGFRYPGAEGEQPGERGQSKGWVDRKHPLRQGFVHCYSLIIRVGQAADYSASVKETWRWHFAQVAPRVVPVDLVAVQRAGLGLLADYYTDYGTVAGFAEPVAGFPYLIDIVTGTVTEPNFVLGFAGRSTESAYLVLRAGHANGDARLLEMGRRTIDFWVRNGGRGLTHTQLSTLDWAWRDDMGIDFYRLKVFLRPVVEGALAALLAYQVERAAGVAQPEWLSWSLACGEWLLAHQNTDGSFFRQYYWSDGTPSFPDKGNSYLPIPLLVALGREMGDQRFTQAATHAGAFCWHEYHAANHFIGGTIDHPNVYDKEAALLSLEAYLSLFEATGEQQWLVAAERAALFAETYILLWNIPMPADDPASTWPEGRDTTGLNFISAGGGGADMYGSFNAYEFARLYQLTGDAHYAHVARLLHYNNKQIVQLHGEHGYGHDGLHQEHWTISPELDRSWLQLNPRSWIPQTGPVGRGQASYTHMYMWTIVAHLYGISKVVDGIGTMDLE